MLHFVVMDICPQFLNVFNFVNLLGATQESCLKPSSTYLCVLSFTVFIAGNYTKRSLYTYISL